MLRDRMGEVGDILWWLGRGAPRVQLPRIGTAAAFAFAKDSAVTLGGAAMAYAVRQTISSLSGGDGASSYARVSSSPFSSSSFSVFCVSSP